MQRAVIDVDRRGEVERAGQLRGDAQRLGRRRRPVSRTRCRAIRRRRSPGRDRRSRPRCRSASGAAIAGMRQLGGDQPLELGDELMDALGRQIESKQLDRDEPIAARDRTRERRARVRRRQSDEEPGMDRRRQEAQCRQRPCAVRYSSREGESIVTLKRTTLQCVRRANTRAAAVDSRCRVILRQ